MQLGGVRRVDQGVNDDPVRGVIVARDAQHARQPRGGDGVTRIEIECTLKPLTGAVEVSHGLKDQALPERVARIIGGVGLGPAERLQRIRPAA